MTLELYGGAAPDNIAKLLVEAMEHYGETELAESKLLEAKQQSPRSLAVYFSLYKFYFYKKRLVDAEQTTREALIEAATQAGFHPNWDNLDANSTDWSDKIPRFYLFSLKALAFIKLRQGDNSACRHMLAKLDALDPGDSVGASVIREIHAGAH